MPGTAHKSRPHLKLACTTSPSLQPARTQPLPPLSQSKPAAMLPPLSHPGVNHPAAVFLADLHLNCDPSARFAGLHSKVAAAVHLCLTHLLWTENHHLPAHCFVAPQHPFCCWGLMQQHCGLHGVKFWVLYLHPPWLRHLCV